MNKYYFTYGLDEQFPFQNGWTIVYAHDINSAARIFKEIHPNPHNDDILNCADYYPADQFERREIFENGNFGGFTHEIIGAFTLDKMIALESVHKAPKICSICGKYYNKHGNDARPINKGWCCDKCNIGVVVPARIKGREEYAKN